MPYASFNLEADIMRNITGTESFPIDLTIAPYKDFTFTSPDIADTFENEFMWIAGIVGGVAIIALVGGSIYLMYNLAKGFEIFASVASPVVEMGKAVGAGAMAVASDIGKSVRGMF